MAMRLIKADCLSCHNEEKSKGGLKLTSREAMFKGGDTGVAVVEGKPEESLLITALAPDADPHMPPKKQLSTMKIELLKDWLRAGAPWDASALAGQPSAPRPVALAPLPASYRPIMAMALSPDGSRLAVGCRNEVVLFDVSPTALTFRARASAHLDPVQSLAWTPDGKRLVSGAFRRVILWRADPLAQEREIVAALTDRITALRPLRDGARLALADGQISESGMVRILDLETAQIVRSWPAHGDAIYAMAVSADGKLIATAGGDKLVKIWDTTAGKEIAKLEAHSTQVLDLAFNPDSTQLVTAGADRLLKVWDVKTRENTITMASKAASFNSVVWSASAVFAVTDDGALLRYKDLKTHTGAQSSDTGNERQLGRTDSPLYCVAVTENGERIFAGSSEGHILAWDKDAKLLHDIDVATASTVVSNPPPK